MQKKQRIDLYLVEKKYCKTRSQAQQMIDFSLVKINDKFVKKSNVLVDENDCLIVQPLKYVSRGGLKLEHALQYFKIDLMNKVVLDIGASTGGFTDCCLQNNAKLVYAVDVGTNQLADKLRNHPQVVNLENTNIKDLNTINFQHKIDVIVCDVSFISLKHVFKNLTNLCSPELIMIFLIKPQFELDKKIVDSNKGIIKNHKYHQQAIDNVINYAQQYNFVAIDVIASPITGRKGENQEFLGLFKCQK